MSMSALPSSSSSTSPAMQSEQRGLRPGGSGGGSDLGLYAAILALSVVALLPIAYLLVWRRVPQGEVVGGTDLSFMPAVNASLNGIAAACQLAGYLAIRAKRIHLHRGLMLGALAASTLFFAGYLSYHYVHGDTSYPGSGALRTFYLVLLASHVVLSIVVVPMILLTLYRAARSSFAQHRKLARFTLPIWLYVSVTGILVFWMLRAAGA